MARRRGERRRGLRRPGPARIPAGLRAIRGDGRPSRRAEAISLLSAYFVCGNLDALERLVESAGLRVAANRTHLGTVNCGSVDEFVAAEVESTALRERISAEVCARICEGAREVLRPFTKPEGTAEIPLEGHVVPARKGA
jgi:hypothetical protein